MIHFPPFNFEEPYLDIQQEWGGLFDTYHVDMVMSGHIHYYMRSKPMNNGKVVDSFKKGTVYTVSIGTHGNQFYQYMTLTDRTLKYITYNLDGEIVDELLITK